MSEDQRRIEELLSGLLDDALSGEERREALGLVKRDPEARALFERMRATSEAMRLEEPPALPAELAEKIGERVRRSGGELIDPPRRRWLGPAALTAAASVAAALLIGALLHDQWEALAPRLDYEEPETEEQQAQELEQDVPEPAVSEPVVQQPEAGTQEKEALPPKPGADDPELGTPAPAAVAPREESREKRALATDELDATEEDLAAKFDAAVAREKARIAEQGRKRETYEARRALPEASQLVCASPWISSTRVSLADDAPDDAAALLRELVSRLGGRVETAPDPAVVVPAAGVERFIAGLPATGHLFVGPTPVLPQDRDCLRLRFALPGTP